MLPRHVTVRSNQLKVNERQIVNLKNRRFKCRKRRKNTGKKWKLEGTIDNLKKN